MFSSDWVWFGYFGMSAVLVLWKLVLVLARVWKNHTQKLPLFDRIAKRYLVEAGFFFVFGIFGFFFLYFMNKDMEMR